MAAAPPRWRPTRPGRCRWHRCRRRSLGASSPKASAPITSRSTICGSGSTCSRKILGRIFSRSGNGCPWARRRVRGNAYRCAQSGRKEGPNRQLDPWRVEPEPAFADDPGGDGVPPAACMMDDEPLIRIDDEVIQNACNAEIARKLGRSIDAPRGRREYLDDDHGIRHLDGGVGELLTAVDERVRLVGGILIDTDRHPIRQHVARQAGLPDPCQQRSLRGKFDICMPHPLGRHGIDNAGIELKSSRPALRPGKVLINGHLVLRQRGHGAKYSTGAIATPTTAQFGITATVRSRPNPTPPAVPLSPFSGWSGNPSFVIVLIAPGVVWRMSEQLRSRIQNPGNNALQQWGRRPLHRSANTRIETAKSQAAPVA